MVAKSDKSTRTPLTRERVLAAAVDLADSGGIEALTMRGLAAQLDVEAMSLYYHVPSKDALLDGMAETIVAEVNAEVSEVDGPDPEDDWMGAMRSRLLGARRVMLRHRWAPGVLETRTTLGPQVLVYYDGVVRILRAGDLSFDLIHHALHALGSRALGFSQEMFDPQAGSGDADTTDETLLALASEIPFLVGMIGSIAHDDPDSTIGWCDDQAEFEFSIDVMLEGFERLRLSEKD